MLESEYTQVDSYDEILQQLRSLIDPSFSIIANMANVASLFYWSMEAVNWVGFYLYENGQLMLGPFHGKTACVTIEMGKGVCGTAAQKMETLLVPDVEKFPGHIVCDAASRSELVVPMEVNGKLFAVLDVDSPQLDRFGRKEREIFEAAARLLMAAYCD